MNSWNSATVYYPRKTLLIWVALTAALMAVGGGALLMAGGKKTAREIAGLRKSVAGLARESARLRGDNARLARQAAALEIRLKAAGPRPSPPPRVVVKERAFPLDEAVAVLPGRLFVTVSGVEGGRARIRLAEIRDGEAKNLSRNLRPGETLKFEAGKESFALLLHSLKGDPPRARLSIRRLAPAR